MAFEFDGWLALTLESLSAEFVLAAVKSGLGRRNLRSWVGEVMVGKRAWVWSSLARATARAERHEVMDVWIGISYENVDRGYRRTPTSMVIRRREAPCVCAHHVSA